VEALVLIRFVLDRYCRSINEGGIMSRLGKYARWVGVAGSLGAVAWAMRDRFVSIAVPREPDRPVFRTPPTTSSADDLTKIDGIGLAYARALAQVGISNFAAIAQKTDTELAELLDISESRTVGWVERAAVLRDQSLS